MTAFTDTLYQIRELATKHLERDGQHDHAELIRELEAIATIADGGLQGRQDTIELRLDEHNVATLERGRHCHVTFIRLARGIDGVYELYMEGTGTDPLPDHASRPDVPVEER